MKLKYSLIIALIFFVFAGFSLSQKRSNSSKLIGTWEFVNPYNNRGLIMKLKPDNTFIIQMIMAENSLYRIKGNKMFTTFKRGPKGITSTDTSTIEIKDNSLINTVIKDSKTETIIMHKVRGSRNKKSIVGDYTRKYPNGHNAFSRFTKNGRWIFRVPLQKITGNYSIKDSIITFNYKSPQQYTEKRKFRFKSKSLILKTDKTNTDEIYNKVDYFPED